MKTLHYDEFDCPIDDLFPRLTDYPSSTNIYDLTFKKVAESESESESESECKEESKGEESNRTCCVCLDKEVNTAFDPCGHLSTCQDCAYTIYGNDQNCPICRNSIDKLLTIYR